MRSLYRNHFIVFFKEPITLNVFKLFYLIFYAIIFNFSLTPNLFLGGLFHDMVLMYFTNPCAFLCTYF